MLEPWETLFGYDHLPPHLQAVSERFHRVAEFLCIPELDGSAAIERKVALRKLLEAKDAAVRAVLLQGKSGK